MKIDLLITNGLITTMNPALPEAHWVAIHNGRIFDVGREEPPYTAKKTLNLGGLRAFPGFNDAHCHTTWFGLSLAEVQCTSAGTLDALYDLLAAQAATQPPGSWVFATGYNQEMFGGQYPSLAVLDRVLPEHPLFVRHTSGHACIVNTRALELAGLTGESIPEIDGGTIVRDSSGAPTGVVEERAQSVIQDLLLPRSVEEIVGALDRATAVYATEGITSFTEAGIAGGWIGHSPLELGAYQAALDRGVLRARAQVMVVSDVFDPVIAHAEDPHRLALHAGIRTGLGDDRLHIGPMKIFLDGSMLAWTGAMSEPFATGPANNYGYFQSDVVDLRRTMLEAIAAGWSIGAHAIGDRAVELALETFQEALARFGPPIIPHRIEHGGIVTDEQAALAAHLQVAIVTQPGFMPELGVQMREAMGPDRSPLIHRHQRLMDAGVMVAGSSDRPVATGRPLDIIQSMVDRLDASNTVVGPDERVSIFDAFWAYTVGSAQATGTAGRKGIIAPGYLADLVALSGDPLASGSGPVRDLSVIHTITAGESVVTDATLVA